MSLSILALLAACENKPAPTPETKSAATAAQQVAQPAEATKPAMVVGVMPGPDPNALKAETDALAKLLSDKLGAAVEVRVPPSYAAAVAGLKKNEMQVVYLNGWAYQAGHVDADADLLLVETLNTKPFFYSQWYARVDDTGLTDVSGLKGKRIAVASRESTSYLFGLSRAVEKKILANKQDPKEVFAAVEFAGTDQAAVRMLIDGKVDAAVAPDFVMGRHLSADERGKIKAIGKQGPVPGRGIAVRADMPQAQKDKVKAALMELSSADKTALSKKLFGATTFAERSHYDHVVALEKAQTILGAEFPGQK